MGWSDLSNGTLLAEAKRAFDLLITTDKNLRYQQNLTGRNLAILVLPTTSWPKIQLHLSAVTAAVASIKPADLHPLEVFKIALSMCNEFHSNQVNSPNCVNPKLVEYSDFNTACFPQLRQRPRK